MKRYVATFYRGRWLFALVLLVMVGGAVAGTYSLTHSKYESTARIWVDKAALQSVLDQNNQPVYGYTPPPAQQQADKLYQLAQTDSFLAGAVKGTTLERQLTGAPDRDGPIFAAMRKKLAIGVIGSNTLTITYYGKDPLLCQQIVQGTIDSYRTWLLQSQIDQSAVEVSFYQSQLKIYEDQVSAVTQQLEQYQRENPRPEPSSPQFLQLQQLQRDRETVQNLYTATKSRIDQASIVQHLSDQSGRVEFQVLDKPVVPQRPQSLLKGIKYLGLGIVASFGLVLAAGVLATWLDTTIYTPEDLVRLTDIPVLHTVPHIKPTKMGRRARDAEPPPLATVAGAAVATAARQGAD